MGEITQLLGTGTRAATVPHAIAFSLASTPNSISSRDGGCRVEAPMTMLDAPGSGARGLSASRTAAAIAGPGSSRVPRLRIARHAQRDHRLRAVAPRRTQWRRASRCSRSTQASPSSVLAEPELESLGDALESLARIDERAHWVVEMRYFGGMEIEEIARLPRDLTGDGQTRLAEGARLSAASPSGPAVESVMSAVERPATRLWREALAHIDDLLRSRMRSSANRRLTDLGQSTAATAFDAGLAARGRSARGEFRFSRAAAV